MTRRYLLCPGLVRSRTDGDWHYVSAAQLAQLYGIGPSDYLVLPEGLSHATMLQRDRMLARADLIHLAPRSSGDYALPDKPCPPATPAAPANPYACHNRAPSAAPDCQYTTSDLGRVDPRCTGCRWRAPDA